MFVVIYRWRLHPERKHGFVVNGKRMTLGRLVGGTS